MTANKAAFAKARAIKASQEQALRDLPTGKLYIVLYLRYDPPVANNFHWAFYHHPVSPNPGGLKSHIRNEGSGWIKDQAANGNIFKEQFLVCLIGIGAVPEEQEGSLHQLLAVYDERVNDEGTTCRTWLLKVWKTLIDEGLLYGNAMELEEECMEFGNREMEGAARNEQPRPVLIAMRAKRPDIVSE